MSWFERLAALYDTQIHAIPLYHEQRVISAVANISSSGELLGIRNVRFSTAVPVTERSAVRTNAVVPHPLFDTSEYLTTRNPRKHDAYLEQLSRWVGSPYSCEELRAVFSCVSRWLIAGDFPERGLIGFSVNGEGLWEDRRLKQLWIGYCRATADRCVSCSGTGAEEPIALLHPKGLLRDKPSAKLISANENGRLLFSDRLSSIAEAIPLGAESSMKAQRALSELLEEYGVKVGGSIFAGFTEKGGIPLKAMLLGGDKSALLASLSGETAVILAVSAHSEGRISFSMYREVKCAELEKAVLRLNRPLADYDGITARECIRKIDALLK